MMAIEEELPDGWETYKLDEITKVIGGGTPKTKIEEYWGDEIVWLSPVDLPPIGKITNVSDSKKKITKLGLKKSSAKLLPIGSVVYSSRASIGKIGIAEVELCTNQGFTNFICGDKINNKYLVYALKHYTEDISRLSNSTTFKEISKTNFKQFRIPVPPLEEQKRIVAKLNAVFEKIDECIALVSGEFKDRYDNSLLDYLVGLKKSLLEDAFRGKL